MMSQVGAARAVAQPGRAQATGMFKQQRGGVARRGGAVAAVTLGPVLLLASLGGGPVAVGKRAKVLRIHVAIVLADRQGARTH